MTMEEVQTLRKLGREGTAEAAADASERTVASVKIKTKRTGISFRSTEPAALRDQK
jgi:hypothetical protein